jgi:predicted enzyme related to lactoylglutathione lyase
MNDVADHGIRFGRVAAMLPVKDMEKACAFYMKVLGFTKTFENGDPMCGELPILAQDGRVAQACESVGER